MSGASIGPVDIEFAMSNLNFEAELAKLRAQIAGIGSQAQRQSNTATSSFNHIGAAAKTQGSQIESSFDKAGKAVMAYISLQAGVNFTQQLIETRGEFQKMDIAFTTMLGSKEKSNLLMSQVVDLAAKTPFTLQQVGAGAKQLLAYQVPANQVIDTLTRLGNVAAGVSVPVDRLILAYGQVKAKGKLDGQDLRQFTEAGVPMIHELAKVMGVADTQISKMVENGKVGFPEVQKVIKNLTNEGGMFYNMMEAQSKSLSGMVSNLGDAWSQALNKFGAANQGELEGGIKLATEVVTHFQDVVDILKVIVATYGAYKAAVIAAAISQAAMTAVGNISAWLELAKGIRTAKDAQVALSLATSVSPIGLISAAIALAATAYFTFSKSATAAEVAQAELEKRHDSVKVSVDRQSMAYRALSESVDKTKPGTEERKKAVAELTTKYGTLLPKVDLINASERDFAAALRQGNAELTKRQKLNSALGQLQSSTSDYLISKETERRTVRDYQKTKNDDTKSNFQVYTAFDTMQQAIEDRKAKEIIYNKLKQEFDAIKGGAGAAETNTDPFAGLVKYSEDYWKVIVKQAEDARSKIADNSPSGNTAIAKYTQTIADAQKHIDAITNKKQKDPSKTFDEQLKKVKEQYDLYYKWVNSPDTNIQNAADEQFNTLLNKGKSYADYLTKLKAGYEKTPVEKRSKEQQSEYEKITASLQQELGGESPFDTFKKKLEQSKKDAESLSAYLEVIKKYQGDYNGDMSQQGININKLLQEQKNATDTQINDNTSQLIEQYQGYIGRKKQIDSQYANDVKLINDRIEQDKANGDSVALEKDQQALVKRKKALDYELGVAADESLEETDIYKKAFAEQGELSDKRLEQRIADIKKVLATEEMSAEKRKELERSVTDNAIQLIEQRAAAMERAMSTLNNFTSTFVKITKSDSGIGDLVQSTTQMASAYSKLGDIQSQLKAGTITATEATKLSTESLQSGGMAVLDLIGKIYEMGNASAKAQIAAEHAAYIASLKNYTVQFEIARLIRESARDRMEYDDAHLAALKTEQTILAEQKASNTTAYNELLAKLQKSKALGGSDGKSSRGTATGDKGGDTLSVFSTVETNAKGQRVARKSTDAEIMARLKAYSAAGKLNEDDEILYKQLQSIYDEGKSINDALDQALKAQQEILTGTTASSITDSIVEGFRNGKTAATDFADNFTELMQNAMLSLAADSTINTSMNDWYAQFAADSQSGGGLSKEEVAALQEQYGKNIADYNTLVQQMSEASGIALKTADSSSDTNSLSGAVKGVTQETASLVAGQMNAIRINQAQGISIMNSQLAHLSKIEVNTAVLHKIYDYMKSDTLRSKGL